MPNGAAKPLVDGAIVNPWNPLLSIGDNFWLQSLMQFDTAEIIAGLWNNI